MDVRDHVHFEQLSGFLGQLLRLAPAVEKSVSALLCAREGLQVADAVVLVEGREVRGVGDEVI